MRASFWAQHTKSVHERLAKGRSSLLNIGHCHASRYQGDLAMPKSTFVEIRPEEQAEMLPAYRRARYG